MKHSINEVQGVGPNGCTHAIIIKGEHFWCDEQAGHTGWPHGSVAAQTIWGDAAESTGVCKHGGDPAKSTTSHDSHLP